MLAEGAHGRVKGCLTHGAHTCSQLSVNEATKLLILLYREIEYKSIKLRCLLRFRSNQLEERIASPGVRIGKAREGKKSKIYGPTPQQQEGVSPSKALRQEHNN